MKKILGKLFKRKEAPLPSRITSDTVAEHRERILAGGRRFKYPIQYARHRLVINAILISVSALIVVVVILWWQLYPSQNTSEFMYRITKVIPVPVAVVDGQSVLYSDYLVEYLGQVRLAEIKMQLITKSDDGKRELELIKQESMQNAISNAYAIKLARGMGLSISEVEWQTSLKALRQTINGETTEKSFYAGIYDYFKWSPSEFSRITKNNLLRQKVSYAMDEKSQEVAQSVVDAIKANPDIDFKTIPSLLNSDDSAKVVYDTSGWVPKSNNDDGQAVEAAKLTKGQVSPIYKPTNGDGYYIIKLVDINNEQVNYEFIRVPLTAFAKSLKAVIDAKKVVKYISL